MRIHAAHLSGKPDGPVALRVPKVEYDYLENAWIDGERRVDLDHSGAESNKLTLHPDWVAASQPCPTCADEAVRGLIDLPDWDNPEHSRMERCSDCIDGKPKVELTYPCPSCHGEPSHLWSGTCSTCGVYPHGVGGPGKNSGWVSAGVGTITLVPVVASLRDSYQDITDPGSPQRCVFVALEGEPMAMWVREARPDEPWPSAIPLRISSIVKPPRVKPGDTVAIWTAAEEPATP